MHVAKGSVFQKLNGWAETPSLKIYCVTSIVTVAQYTKSDQNHALIMNVFG